jgi:membrane-bound metal-dependent hydrolase YbcI (DUF457 family)
VSWAAHELESYFLQKHVKAKVSYLAILLGCFLPDLFTKLPVYGIHIGSFTMDPVQEPWKYHRGWPGVGFTHSLFFVTLFSMLVLALFKNRAWFIGLLIGGTAHVLTDVCDSIGTMALFPFTTQQYTIGMWAYASQEGKFGDAAAYYSSLGGVWDFFWLLLCIGGWKVFTRDFFFEKVVPQDRAWDWLRRTFGMSNRAMLALYRAYFLYGATRIFAWFIWARARTDAPIDWSWGGPSFVEKATVPDQTWQDVVWNTGRGLVLATITGYLMWRFLIRPLWERAGRHEDALPARPAPAG